MYRQGYKQKDIAVVLKKCKSVISREIKRNTNPKTGKYHHLYAQDMATIRKERFRQPKKDDLLSETNYNFSSTRRRI